MTYSQVNGLHVSDIICHFMLKTVRLCYCQKVWAITCIMAPSEIISYYNTINIYTISNCLKIILLKLYLLENVKNCQHSLPTLILESSEFSLPNLIMTSFHKKQL